MSRSRHHMWIRRSSAILMVVLAGFGSPSIAGAAEFLEYYKIGLAAVESQQWSRAAEMMQKAIAGQSEEKNRLKKSLFFRRYLPHFYLGKARFESGDCQGALAAWGESERQGVVRRFPEYQQIEKGRAVCRQVAELQDALDEASRVVEGAAAAAKSSRLQLSQLSVSDADTRTLLDRQAEAEGTLGRVQQRLESVDISLDEVEEIAAIAAVVTTEIAAIRLQIEAQHRVQVEQRQSQLAGQLEKLVKRARQQLAASQFLQPYPPQVASQRSNLQQALERARSAESGSLKVGELQTLRTELERATRNLRQAASPPPRELETAATAYLSRDYGGALEVLDGLDFDSDRAASHAHLLRAAAMFALYQASGATNRTLLEQASKQVLACHDTDPERVPPIAVFPTNFVAFFDREVMTSNVRVDEKE